MRTKGEPAITRLAGEQSGWQTACELLKTSQYERVAAVLYEAQIASERAGDAILADTLAAARQICLAGSQCRAEVEWHRRACEKADQREQELRQQIYSILDLISGHGTPETREVRARSSSASTVEVGMLERDAPQTIESPSLWQRVQTLLGRRTSPQSPESESPIMSAELLAAAPTEKKEGPLPPSLAVYCLGAFRVYQDDQLIADWDSLKARSVFKYLVAHRGAPIVKDILMDLFWPDAGPEAARRNLHQAIYSLRQTLRRGHPNFQHIQFENSCYLLNPEIDIWLNLEEFEKHIQVGRRAESVVHHSQAGKQKEWDGIVTNELSNWMLSQTDLSLPTETRAQIARERQPNHPPWSPKSLHRPYQ